MFFARLLARIPQRQAGLDRFQIFEDRERGISPIAPRRHCASQERQ